MAIKVKETKIERRTVKEKVQKWGEVELPPGQIRRGKLC